MDNLISILLLLQRLAPQFRRVQFRLRLGRLRLLLQLYLPRLGRGRRPQRFRRLLTLALAPRRSTLLLLLLLLGLSQLTDLPQILDNHGGVNFALRTAFIQPFHQLSS